MLTLYVDGPRWRASLAGTLAANPGLIPVTKGNGYGFGVGRLARRAEWLGTDMVAVGTYSDVADVERRFSGDILVLQPWRPFLPDVPYSGRIVHTVTRSSDLTQLAARATRPRVVLEGLTSMCRFGFRLPDLATIGSLAANGRAAPGVRLEGHALHLPLGGGHLPEVERWLSAAPARRWFVSHVAADELGELRRRHPGTSFRPRVGTALWLGDRSSLSPRATVLDMHAVSRGDRVGYRQGPILRDGVLLVVAGGTSHGIALEAPSPAASVRQRAVSLARGGLDAVGRALSPYVIDGKQRWFVEPPHMQVSMVFLPAGAALPAVGDEVSLQVRNTTTTFDRVVVS
jgi:alanine racemase-like protein